MNFDRIKWMLAFIFMLISLCVYQTHIVPYARSWVALAFFSSAVWIMSQTMTGKKTVDFIKSSRLELHRVHWIKSSEVMKISGIVMITVLVVSLILYAIDSVLGYGVSLILLKD